MSIQNDSATRLAFFESLFGIDEGYVCISTTRPPARRDTFAERFFDWPKQKADMMDFIEKVAVTHNVYYCVNLLSAQKRKKDNALPLHLVWADLDTCNPEQLDIPPQILVESSPNRYQAIWKLETKVDPRVAENYSRRIAYHYAHLGVDKSGFDLTQLLRVPGTYNFKYQGDDMPIVELRADIDARLPVSVFDTLPPAVALDDIDVDLEVPALQDLPSPEMIVYRYQMEMQTKQLATQFARYYSEEPPSDWSGHLWRLLLLCFEVGMTADETFVIAKTSKSNKYERDGRPDSHLWREVLKAERERKTVDQMIQDHRYLAMPALLSKKEEEELKPTLIDEYMTWATESTDAVPEFHEISCAMIMSALMSTTLRLKTSRSRDIVPNLWAMILGESTLTRKTTAMDMAMDFVMDIDRDLLLGTDATVEGLLSALSLRPKMVSIFYRDEITGFFDSLQRREYLAGMHEMMTKMYDVPPFLSRRLRKETFTVSEPIFIFFGGGVPDKMYSIIDESFFASGFVPRFLIMRGYGDLARVRPTGPPLEVALHKRAKLQSTFQAFYDMYTNQQVAIQLGDGQQMLTTPNIYVNFTDEMWERAQTMEMQLLESAAASPEETKALPMFSRMFVSLLKLTMLFAGARQEPENLEVQADMNDLLSAAWYIQKWGRHAVDLIRSSGVTGDESKMMSIYRTVEKHPGIQRSQIMQRHRVNAREMQLIEDTLVQRQLIVVQTKGRSKSLWPIGA